MNIEDLNKARELVNEVLKEYPELNVLIWEKRNNEQPIMIDNSSLPEPKAFTRKLGESIKDIPPLDTFNMVKIKPKHLIKSLQKVKDDFNKPTINSSPKWSDEVMERIAELLSEGLKNAEIAEVLDAEFPGRNYNVGQVKTTITDKGLSSLRPGFVKRGPGTSAIKWTSEMLERVKSLYNDGVKREKIVDILNSEYPGNSFNIGKLSTQMSLHGITKKKQQSKIADDVSNEPDEEFEDVDVYCCTLCETEYDTEEEADKCDCDSDDEPEDETDEDDDGFEDYEDDDGDLEESVPEKVTDEKWSDDVIETIKEHLDKMSFSEIADLLNQTFPGHNYTTVSVQNKTHSLGITKTKYRDDKINKNRSHKPIMFKHEVDDFFLDHYGKMDLKDLRWKIQETHGAFISSDMIRKMCTAHNLPLPEEDL